MRSVTDFYASEIENELALAARCLDRAGKAAHLNRASHYATLREWALQDASAGAGDLARFDLDPLCLTLP